jgi:hypothetical protein
MIVDDVNEMSRFPSVSAFIRHRQGRSNFTDLHRIKHPARRLLRHISRRGAPVIIQTAPWDDARKDAAVERGSHKSALEFRDFLREEMAAMVQRAIWTVLPYRCVRNLKNLRLAPIGVVPSHGRRPRTIVDLTFNGVNEETLKLSPQEALQFGRALERIIAQVVHADPRFGPVQFIKVDMSDGFYRVHVKPEDAIKLGVAFPSLDGEEPMIAIPICLPMGWTESPPYFCAFTETVADVANERILKGRHPPLHKLDRLASSPPDESDRYVGPPVRVRRDHIVTGSVPAQQIRNPLLPIRQRILGVIDIFVDDFIGAAQGSTRRLNRIRRILMEAIDDIFRPLDAADSPARKEPISVKKLRQGDAAWSTVKNVLGWIIDSANMTLTLPKRRLERLAELLASVPPTQHRLALDKWHSLLGELRSMSIALPGSRGLFSQLQAALRTNSGNRLRLGKGFHEALDDFRWIHDDLATRPTKLQELVPVDPTTVGAHDASGFGAGGICLPGPTAIPRNARVKSLRPDSTLRRHRLQDTNPILWRAAIPGDIQERLVSWKNLTGDVTNSDLELAGSLLQQEAVAQCYDVRERTTKDATDNLATMFWSRKGSTTSTGPPARLLRMAAIHQRFHRYLNLKDYLPGKRNTMADDASRLLSLSDADLLTYFNSTYPQSKPWVLWTPPKPFLSAVTMALRRQTSPTELFLHVPQPLLDIGVPGAPSARGRAWTLPFKSSKTPSPSSKFSSADTVPAKLPPAKRSPISYRGRCPTQRWPDVRVSGVP